MTNTSVSKTQWNPATYLEFAGYRARPAEDLLARLDLKIPGAVYDLGCGPGNLTRKLKDRWSERTIIGMDSSAEMLAKAEQSYGKTDIAWQRGDIASWTPDQPAALVFTNAALHWVPDHDRLFPRLMAAVAPGGLFAMQMPMTGEAPYHAIVRQLLASPRWHDRLADVRDHAHPLTARHYYDLVCHQAANVDTWETHYHHVLKDIDAVTVWVSGTALVPYLTVLDENEKAAFLTDYTEIARGVYPPSRDGQVLFTMRRIFMVAERKA